jgi:glycosyltransferase involved in cell wall biosynthesis
LSSPQQFDVICLSLEPWDDVWRRNQHLASELLQLRPSLRLLFAGNPVDITWSLRQGHLPALSPLRRVGDTGRLWAMSPRKWLPRRIWPRGDQALFHQVVAASRRLGFARPVLWINDSTYAPFVSATGWASVYDVTDDWLLGDGVGREMDRQHRNDAQMLREATEVVVCSPALAQTRGRMRPIHLIPNGVDLDHLRKPMGRPDDVPEGPIVLYQGTLTEGRLDIELCGTLARALSGRATLVFVGPNSLSREVSDQLVGEGAVILGARPYSLLPGYLQHADVLVVPHQVTPFVESLDPIKAREFVALGRPVVATPVAGFRDLDPPITVATREAFTETVLGLLEGGPTPPGPGPIRGEPQTWTTLATEFLAVLEEADASLSGP